MCSVVRQFQKHSESLGEVIFYTTSTNHLEPSRPFVVRRTVVVVWGWCGGGEEEVRRMNGGEWGGIGRNGEEWGGDLVMNRHFYTTTLNSVLDSGFIYYLIQ